MGRRFLYPRGGFQAQGPFAKGAARIERSMKQLQVVSQVPGVPDHTGTSQFQLLNSVPQDHFNETKCGRREAGVIDLKRCWSSTYGMAMKCTKSAPCTNVQIHCTLSSYYCRNVMPTGAMSFPSPDQLLAVMITSSSEKRLMGIDWGLEGRESDSGYWRNTRADARGLEASESRVNCISSRRSAAAVILSQRIQCHISVVVVVGSHRDSTLVKSKKRCQACKASRKNEGSDANAQAELYDNFKLLIYSDAC